MIPVCVPVINGNENKYVLDCLETNWISSHGKYIELFEDLFSRYTGMKYGIACSSCTAGLYMALLSLGIGEGDEVIIPDFTLIVNANTVIQCGARPVLVDVDQKTWCIDPDLIENKISKRTKAIMVVHMYGHPCDMPKIMEIAKKHNLYVIEDCAEAHGAEINNQKVGSFGEISCFSFYANKIITTGEGGMVLCDDTVIAEKLRLLRNQGFEEPRFVHNVIGFNFRMTNVQAAIGLAQTETIEEKVEKKRWIAKTYSRLIGDNKGLTLPYEAENAKNVYWMYGILTSNSFGASKTEIMRKLEENGVETRSFFCPMHLQPVFINGKDARYPDISNTEDYHVSTQLWNNGLYLPSGMNLDEQTISEVVHKLLECRSNG